MEFKLINAELKDKSVIYNMMQLYTYELSKYEDESSKFELNHHGLYNVKYLDYFWIEKDRHPYILKYNDELAGFVLVRLNEEKLYEVCELFVLNKFRRMNAGKYMANYVFKKFNGDWEIRILLKNESAQKFWENVINEFSNGKYEKKYIRNNTRLAIYFSNNI